ncbi:MAG: hypothetical protein U0105_07740 [Candidatus Obscuribacterales bacterium]
MRIPKVLLALGGHCQSMARLVVSKPNVTLKMTANANFRASEENRID